MPKERKQRNLNLLFTLRANGNPTHVDALCDALAADNCAVNLELLGTADGDGTFLARAFGQCWEPWCDLHYSCTGTHTFCQTGCLVTALASLAVWVGYDTDPQRLGESLDRDGAFEGDLLCHPTKVSCSCRLLKWHTADDLVFYSPLYEKKETSLVDWRNRPADIELLKNILSKQPVVVEVDSNPGKEGRSQHFVLALAYLPDPKGGINDDVLIMDPLTGGMGSITRYFHAGWLFDGTMPDGVTMAARTMTGLRVWEVLDGEPGDGGDAPAPPHPGTEGLFDGRDLWAGINAPFNIPRDDPQRSAGQWCINAGVPAFVFIPWPMGTSVLPMPDATYLKAQHPEQPIKVVGNIRVGWGRPSGPGTFPCEADRAAHIAGAIGTIDSSEDVDAWTFYCEVNKPEEQPLDELVEPETVAETIAEIVLPINAKRKEQDLPPLQWAVGAFDPTNNAIGMNPNDFMRAVYNRLDELECWPTFIDLHGYVRGPDTKLVADKTDFEFMPGHGLNFFHQIETQLAALPAWTKALPVMVSEFNHLWKTVEPDWGWVDTPQGAAVIHAGFNAVRDWNATSDGHKIRALCLYRWMGDRWDIHNKSNLLSAFVVNAKL